MSQKRTTKIFGMDLSVDPKIIVLALIVLAGVIYYFTSRTDESNSNSGQSASAQPVVHTLPAPPPSVRPAIQRTTALHSDVLKIIPVDGSRGDIDPTLRLQLLDRVKQVSAADGAKNLFAAGAPQLVAAASMQNLVKQAPKLTPKPITPIGPPPPPPLPPTPPFTIALKYYGFAKSKGRAVEGNRGLFLDGDNILIGAEGDTLEKRYLIVALTPNSARLEDTIAKQGQDLPVTPEAQTEK